MGYGLWVMGYGLWEYGGMVTESGLGLGWVGTGRVVDNGMGWDG